MKIECSNCLKLYNISDDRLPPGRGAAFNCKKCGTKIILEPLKGDSINKKTDPLKFPEADSASECNQDTGPNEENLKVKILQSIDELPPMPQVVTRTQALIADYNSDSKKIAEIIETDQGIASKVLKVANSALYGMSGRISTIQHASVVLGYKTLGEIVTISGTEKILNGKLPGYGYNSNDLWKHSLAVAQSAKIVADMKNPNLLDEAHTAGLIHDVGKIILDDHIFKQRAEIDNFMQTEEKTFIDAEIRFFGFDHANIASEICKKWHFPEAISLAIKCHHQPSESNGDELSYILHAADYIAMLSGIGYDDDDFLYELEEGTQDFLKLKQEDVSQIVMEVTEMVNKIST
jgi:putative nucleotidyltransferase with HDIG domain